MRQGPLPGGRVELPLPRAEVHAVEPTGIFAYRLVAALEHVLQDAPDGLPGLRIAAGAAGEQRVERLEGRDGQHAHHSGTSR